MRKTIIIVLVLAAALMVQCKREIIKQDDNHAVEIIDVELYVNNDDSKTMISPSGIVTWETGDKIYVVGAKDGYLGYIAAQNAGSSAYFSGSINTISENQKFHYYYVGDEDFTLAKENGDTYYTYDISSQYGTLDDIASNCMLMHYESTQNVEVGQTNLGVINMVSMFSIVKMKFNSSSRLDMTDKVKCVDAFASGKLNVKTSEMKKEKGVIAVCGVEKNKECYIALMPGEQTFSFVQEPVGKTLTKNINANTIYFSGDSENQLPVDITMNVPIGGIDGRFSVGENSKGEKEMVIFSNGNLQYIGSASTPYWKFADNQWDYLGKDKNYTDNINADRDLFGWGTSGSEHIKLATTGEGVKYKYPYNTSKDTPGSTENHTGYGPNYSSTPDGPEGNVTCKSDITGSWFDWGVANPIANGGNEPNMWRTMTKDEWSYLLNRKNGGAFLSFPCRISGNNGFIFLSDEDNANAQQEQSFDSWNETPSFSKIPAGAAFLPMCSYRKGTGDGDTAGANAFGNDSRYHSSTHRDKEGTTATYDSSWSCGPSLNSKSYGVGSGPRSTGRGVRLVHGIRNFK